LFITSKTLLAGTYCPVTLIITVSLLNPPSSQGSEHSPFAATQCRGEVNLENKTGEWEGGEGEPSVVED
jgi:hypothetical protein